MKKKRSYLVTVLIVVSLLTSCVSAGGYRPSEDEKALMMAILYRQTDSVENLLKSRANPNSRNVAGQTALMSALSIQNFEMAEMLLAYGADINMADSSGRTALFYAIKPIQQRWLIERGSDIDFLVNNKSAFETWCGISIVLSETKKNEIVSISESQGLPITREQLEEEFWITKADMVESINLYIDAGYDINKTASEINMTPLIITALSSNYELMHELLNMGADPRITTTDGDDALNIISRIPANDSTVANTDNDYNDILVHLLATGADVEAIDSYQETPLCNATKFDYPGRVKFLLAKDGCGVDTPARNGETAMFKAQSVSVAELLFKNGGDLEYEGPSGMTPLFRVISADVVKYYLDLGANIHHVSNNNNSILSFTALGIVAADKVGAATYPFVLKTEVLIDYGIDVNFVSDKGTSLNIVSPYPLDDMIALLKSAGAHK